ncbi:MAG TPA: hypothetical protein VFJ77_03915 [Gaiellaceae bacterium]|nr:hypothetical protein [Gaiellaceae bacterium]
MKIGDLVTWRGRPYRLRGFDPMGVEIRCAYLEDAETGEVVAAPADEVEPAPAAPG